ncbi:MAG: cysteine--tRNA ligase, partial [Herbaspirillum sp.]
RASGFDVTYVRNITDIDDKIIRRAQERGVSMVELTRQFIDAMHEDAAALGVQKPDYEPRATSFVPQMLGLIETLARKGLAYQAGDGDVNYSVRGFPNYGKLSGKSVDDLRAGERVDVNTGKHDPLDFVLWKSAKASEPDEAKWTSPWGSGRPGWHIECSAMSCDLLGQHFDIHGGGQDLQFPHHENEIAQSEGASGGTFVNYWMHNGFVRVDNEKMSKSLGNFFTIREILQRYDAEVVRFFILRAHYRSPLNYSDAHLDDARQGLSRLYTALKEVVVDDASLEHDEPHAIRFFDAMNDDFNTAQALSVLFDLANEVNRDKSPVLARQLIQLGRLLGLLNRSAEEFFKRSVVGDSVDEAQIQQYIEARSLAKQQRNFIEADRIRAQLLKDGIVLEDKPNSVTSWRRA